MDKLNNRENGKKQAQDQGASSGSLGGASSDTTGSASSQENFSSSASESKTRGSSDSRSAAYENELTKEELRKEELKQEELKQENIKRIETKLKLHLEQISEIIDGGSQWGSNTFKIFGLELQQTFETIPKLVLTRIVFAMLQVLSWALVVMSLVYLVYVLSGSIGLGLVAAIFVHGLFCFGFMLYRNRLKKRISFSATKSQVRELEALIKTSI